jgi:hypothetical protein
MTRQASRRRFRPFTALVLLALVAAAIMYLRCGEQFGLGGGQGEGSNAERGEPASDKAAEKADESGGEPQAGKGAEADEVRPAVGGAAAAPERCKLRLDSSGLTLDGKASTTDEAVTACKQSGGAELTVTGDAVFGERERLREALDQGGVEVFVREGAAPEK